MSKVQLMLGDCLERMKEIPDGSVDMILTDPPYGTVRNAGLDGWENKKTDWDVCLDHGKMLEECNRILRTSGALVLFCQDPYTAKLMTETHGNLPFSYRMTWLKDHFANSLIAKKAPVNYTEDICVFFKSESDIKNPTWHYSNKIYNFIGKKKREIFQDFESAGYRKYATLDTFNSFESRRYLCLRRDTYQQLESLYEISRMDGYISFDEMKAIDLEFKSKTKKVFNLQEGKKYKSNVLSYKKDYSGFHPTQKPVALLEDLIKTYTNEGETVLDFTCGSGSTGVAAVNTNRDFIGIEMDECYFKIAKERIANA